MRATSCPICRGGIHLRWWPVSLRSSRNSRPSAVNAPGSAAPLRGHWTSGRRRSNANSGGRRLESFRRRSRADAFSPQARQVRWWLRRPCWNRVDNWHWLGRISGSDRRAVNSRPTIRVVSGEFGPRRSSPTLSPFPLAILWARVVYKRNHMVLYQIFRTWLDRLTSLNTDFGPSGRGNRQDSCLGCVPSAGVSAYHRTGMNLAQSLDFSSETWNCVPQITSERHGANPHRMGAERTTLHMNYYSHIDSGRFTSTRSNQRHSRGNCHRWDLQRGRSASWPLDAHWFEPLDCLWQKAS